MSQSQLPFLLNVGFIAHQDVGYSRDFPFKVAKIGPPEDKVLTNVVGNARVTKTTQGILVQVNISAQTEFECVRCLIDHQQSLTITFTELFVYRSQAENDDELIFPENGQIDLWPLAWEYLHLEIPINPVCQTDCLGLCAECGENKNEFDCGHKSEVGDPRFSILNSLLDKE